MRIDASNARTVLVAAIGGWALVFAALSLAGLGSRIGSLDDDGGEAAPVGPAPAVAPPAPPLSSYGDVAARPLFSGDRRPHPFFIDPQGEDEGEAGFDYVLTSVLRAPDFAMAILQPSDGGDSIRLKIGEAPPAASNWLLDSVDARSVVFTTPEGPRTLELRVFDGSGGQPPTPMTPLPDGSAPAQASSQRARAQMDATVANAAGAAQRAAEAAAAAAQAPQTAQSQARGAAGRQASPPPEPNAGAEAAPAAAGPSEAQVEAIRRRIEERRARLRQQQQQSTSPNP